MNNFYAGYTETAEQTEARLRRMQAWKEQHDLCFAIVAELEPEIMRIGYAVSSAFIMPIEYQPRQMSHTLTDRNPTNEDGTYPSPYILGGDMYDPNFVSANETDEMPF